MSEYEELREHLEETAAFIARVQNNPSPWLTWITLLLQELEKQALTVNPMYEDIYEEMLESLRDAIRNRLRTGGWR